MQAMDCANVKSKKECIQVAFGENQHIQDCFRNKLLPDKLGKI